MTPTITGPGVLEQVVPLTVLTRSTSAVQLNSGTSVYGAGGNDTIEFLGAAAVTATVILNGGQGADSINLQSSLNTGGASCSVAMVLTP